MEARPDSALKQVRGALKAGDLEIVGEWELSAGCRILLVGCPLLLFEALALDRAAAAYFPLHVLLVSDGGRTQVSVLKPSDVLRARLRGGAADPVARLENRIARALAPLANGAAKPTAKP